MNPPTYRLLCGDAVEQLRTLEDESVQCVVTSPPYWGLRDYGTAVWDGGDPACEHVRRHNPRRDSAGGDGAPFADRRGGQAAKDYVEPYRDVCGHCGARRVDKQIGLERTPGEYVARLIEVFQEVRRVLRSDGVLWLNLGDTYASDMKGSGGVGKSTLVGTPNDGNGQLFGSHRVDHGVKPKDLVGIPWRVAFELQTDGWYLRSDIVWHKPNPMPESVTDRPTRSHEYLFLLAKSERYYYDGAAIREPDTGKDHSRSVLAGQPSLEPTGGLLPEHKGLRTTDGRNGKGRNKRTVWTIPTQPYPEAHFATFPETLVEPCIAAGSRPGDMILDPFGGSMTTVAVALRMGRSAIGIDLSPDYVALGRERIQPYTSPLFEAVEAVR